MSDVSLDDHRDDGADLEIAACLDANPRQSFFLFAGAGSGKTESLRKALVHAVKLHGQALHLKGQQIAVITYTNDARDEIIGRLQYDPLIKVSTIHSFAWDLIRGFNRDIKLWLEKHLKEDNAELEEKQKKGRPASQAAKDRTAAIAANVDRLARLATIRSFTYSPTGDNRSKDSLSHSEVLRLAAEFITTKPLMQDLVVSRFPILFVDESQDTNARLMDAFFVLQQAKATRICVGLFGDMMQQIYTDGKPDLGTNLPTDWKKPAKKMNHRCPRRVVRLINSVRSEVDQNHKQEHRSDAKEGTARLFIASSSSNRVGVEQEVRSRMAAAAADEKWGDAESVTTLILEHRMAAARLGFEGMFTPLDKARLSKTGVRSGELSLLRLFSKQVLPVFEAKDRKDEFAVAAVVRGSSPFLTKANLARAGAEQLAQIAKAKAGVDMLVALRAATPDLRFLDVLRSVAASGLFEIPRSLQAFVDAAGDAPNEPASAATDDVAHQTEPVEPEDAGSESEQSELLAAARLFLETQFSQISAYCAYINEEAGFATHHSVKGRQFPRVLVVADDASAGGFTYNFEKLLSSPVGDAGSDMTRRLFYVTASRAQQSLAVLIYSKDPKAVAQAVITKGWFDAAEVEVFAN